MLTFAVLAVLLGLVPAAIASAKGHSFPLWWLFGAALLIVALPAALLVPRNREGSRQCPACLSWVSDKASVCAECHRDLPEAAVM